MHVLYFIVGSGILVLGAAGFWLVHTAACWCIRWCTRQLGLYWTYGCGQSMYPSTPPLAYYLCKIVSRPRSARMQVGDVVQFIQNPFFCCECNMFYRNIVQHRIVASYDRPFGRKAYVTCGDFCTASDEEIPDCAVIGRLVLTPLFNYINWCIFPVILFARDVRLRWTGRHAETKNFYYNEKLYSMQETSGKRICPECRKGCFVEVPTEAAAELCKGIITDG